MHTHTGHAPNSNFAAPPLEIANTLCAQSNCMNSAFWWVKKWSLGPKGGSGGWNQPVAFIIRARYTGRTFDAMSESTVHTQGSGMDLVWLAWQGLHQVFAIP